MTIARKTTHDECGGVATGWARAALGLGEMQSLLTSLLEFTFSTVRARVP